MKKEDIERLLNSDLGDLIKTSQRLQKLAESKLKMVDVSLFPKGKKEEFEAQLKRINDLKKELDEYNGNK